MRQRKDSNERAWMNHFKREKRKKLNKAYKQNPIPENRMFLNKDRDRKMDHADVKNMVEYIYDEVDCFIDRQKRIKHAREERFAKEASTKAEISAGRLPPNYYDSIFSNRPTTEQIKWL